MAALEYLGAIFGLGEETFRSIVIAIIGLVGTLGAAGYKLRNPKPASDQKVLFDQVNEFIKTQKEDRDELRKELQEVKEKLEEVEEDNRQKDRKINNLVKELGRERKNGQMLQQQIDELIAGAKQVAADKVKEDNERQGN